MPTMPSHSSFDQALPHRIKQYVSSHIYINIDTMAEELQKQYSRAYGRRKRNSFRNLVSQVYKDMQDHGELTPKRNAKARGDPIISSDSDDDDTDIYVEYEDANMLNQSVSSLYNKTNESPRPGQALPSRSPQSYKQNIKHDTKPKSRNHSKNLSWFIDRGPYSGKRSVEPERDDDVSSSILNDKVTNVSNSPLKNGGNSFVENDVTMISDSDDDVIEKAIMDKVSSNLTNGGKNLEAQIDTNKEKVKTKRKSSAKGSSKKNKSKKNKTESIVENIGDEEFLPGKVQFTLQHPKVTFADVAGNNVALQELARLLLHMSHPEIYSTLGVSPPRGVLLHGPPGCGKTLLGSAVAGQLSLPVLRLAGPELVGGVSGESERRVRDAFSTAVENAPCVLFLDEIDAVAQRRDLSSKDMERRIVAQLLSCLDDLNKNSEQVMVVGATNRPDSLDPALRRAGRFDREICLGIPDEKARKQILAVLCNNLKLAEDLNFDLIARLTPGYVGADLMSLCREAAMHAVTRILNINTTSNDMDVPCSNDILKWLRDVQPVDDHKLSLLSIENKDFELAVLDVQPSAKREGFATVPGVTWQDVGALETVREELSIAILGPVRNPAAFAALGLSRASGVLLAGPPGCGKTLLAKAIANESGINFVSVKGPELLNMYVGESERAVRQCFERARNSSPCVIFFDELDSLCPRRSSAETNASARVVNQMLTELDGLESRKQVFVVAATNRPDIIDPAVLRPGRLDKTLYIGIPSAEDRVKILATITRNGTKPPMTTDVCLERLGKDERCDDFTGADLSALIREASLNAIRGSIQHEWNVILPSEKTTENAVKVTLKNIDDAFSKVCPSISKTDRLMYEHMRKNLQGT